MATQKKATDPTEMALSAIEEALNLTSTTGSQAKGPVPVKDTPRPLDEPLLRGRGETASEPAVEDQKKPEKQAKPADPAPEANAPVVAAPKAEMPRTEPVRTKE